MVFGTWLPSMSVWLKLVLQIDLQGPLYTLCMLAAFRLESFCFLAGMVKERLKK